MEWWRPDFVVPVLSALAAGSLVGYEREFRARAAGFRTHALVALASALLMLAAQHQVEWASSTTPDEVLRIDPVRMAHGVLTGVGFLCGGVIFKEGLSVHGLTTAASLWITSALGMLFGVGMYSLAVAGTVLTLIVLIVFRILDRYMPQLWISDVTLRYRAGAAPSERDLEQILSHLKLKALRVSHSLNLDGVLDYRITLKAKSKIAADDLVSRLSADGRLLGYQVEPRNL